MLSTGLRTASRLQKGTCSIGQGQGSSTPTPRNWVLQSRSSHIGSAALYVPHTTTLDVLPFAPVANPSRRQPVTLQKVKSISVHGPRGSVIVPLHEFVQLHWDETVKEAAAAAPAAPTAAATTPDAEIEIEPRKLTLSVENKSERRQRSIWGLTRALLASAIEGVTDGHTVTLRLVGVGYRATVEADPFPRPDKFQAAFQQLQESAESAAAVAAAKSISSPSSTSTSSPASSSSSSSSLLGYFTSASQRDYYQERIRSLDEQNKAGTQRLALRLGFSHPIHLAVPRGIVCTTPAPTRIVLKSADKELMGLFASSIRKWRPPEPYKGKGVFVGDETIKLKAPRRK